MIKTIITLLSALIIFCQYTKVYPESAYVKTIKVYKFTLTVIRIMDTAVKNFPGDGTKEEFQEIKKKFQEATEEYFGQNYFLSHQKFKNLNLEMSILLHKMATNYLKRAKNILDSTSKETFDILIEFGPNSSYLPYFQKPFDPLRGVKPYNEKFTEKEYHYFFARETIRRYLEEGYKKYHLSKKLFDDPEFKYLKKKKNKTMKIVNFIVQRYMDIIKFCRLAKQYGIEIHKIRKIHQFGDILRKYNITSKKVTPIFDDRIPEEFKVDAIDNKKLLHSIELQRLKKYTGK